MEQKLVRLKAPCIFSQFNFTLQVFYSLYSLGFKAAGKKQTQDGFLVKEQQNLQRPKGGDQAKPAPFCCYEAWKMRPFLKYIVVVLKRETPGKMRMKSSMYSVLKQGMQKYSGLPRGFSTSTFRFFVTFISDCYTIKRAFIVDAAALDDEISFGKWWWRDCDRLL